MNLVRCGAEKFRMQIIRQRTDVGREGGTKGREMRKDNVQKLRRNIHVAEIQERDSGKMEVGRREGRKGM